MIEAFDISRSFGSQRALENISFTIPKGQVVTLMGANGAGKSTLFDILATIDHSFQGKAEIDGMDVRKDFLEIRKRIGYVPGRFSLYSDLSVRENLEFFASAHGTSAKDAVKMESDLWKELEPYSSRMAGKLSGGMKQKLSICCAMVHDPKVLLLDEPTVGVDPVSRLQMWKELKMLKQKGTTVLVSTHYLDEASLSDSVILLHEGKILAYDTPENITGDYSSLEDAFIGLLTPRI